MFIFVFMILLHREQWNFTVTLQQSDSEKELLCKETTSFQLINGTRLTILSREFTLLFFFFYSSAVF